MADQNVKGQTPNFPFRSVRTIPGDIYQLYRDYQSRGGSIKVPTIPGDVAAVISKGRREMRKKAFVGKPPAR